MRSQPLQNNSDRFGLPKDMDTRIPKASSSRASSLRTTHDIERPSSAWHGPLISRDGPSHEQRFSMERGCVAESQEERMSLASCPPPPHHMDYPEELAQMIMTMAPNQYYEDLAEAYREASDSPPITKLSLSELDIQHIITNVRLRHDVNFDRDLSFRPNLDGAKGQQKKQSNNQYWKALEAELELYARLFQGTPAPKVQEGERWMALIQNAQRRIPIMFKTLQEVLKSLVPDRDHGRVEEHLDVPMLMQEIQRGVCDLVRLAEWMAQLLKEHCAPMRDGVVNGMVAIIRAGVSEHSSAQIVDGLRELFAILETMKLDVANHQIRNLKTLLIEDTINFEKQYHLERLVGRRSRVNVDAAHSWYSHAAWEFAEQGTTQPRSIQYLQLEILVRAVVAQFFNRNGRHEFPETFYLDQDRLRSLKAEVEDLVHIEVCMDTFAAILEQFGCDGPVSPSTRHQLHTSLLAIMGGAVGYGSQQWVMNSEALSLEILRQASLVAGRPLTFSHDTLMGTNEHLLHMFYNSSRTHNPRLETVLLNRVLACVDRHTNSTATDLFNNLVPAANAIPSQPTHFSHLNTTHTSISPTLNPETARWQHIANRVTHIILLHWRIWERIAYVQEDSPGPTPPRVVQEPTIPSPQPIQPTQQSPQTTTQHDAQIVTTMKTGDSLESGQEALVPHETHSQ